MKTEQQTAEAYVMEQLPELRYFEGDNNSFLAGSFVKYHPIQLQHWLRVLGHVKGNEVRDFLLREFGPNTLQADLGLYKKGLLINFDLTTGQPAQEADYKAFNDIVGI